MEVLLSMSLNGVLRRIKVWWLIHHYFSIAIAALLLTWYVFLFYLVLPCSYIHNCSPFLAESHGLRIVSRFHKLRAFFVVSLLLTGRCYEAEICTILLPLRCAFALCIFLKFSFSVRKPWTIVRRFNQISFHAHNSSLERAIELKFASFYSS